MWRRRRRRGRDFEDAYAGEVKEGERREVSVYLSLGAYLELGREVGREGGNEERVGHAYRMEEQ